MTRLDELVRIAEVEFAAVIIGVQALEPKRRIFLSDGSFIDVWLSIRFPDRFGFHWERRHLDGRLFRYDNFPDPAWNTAATFPFHFHDGSEDHVVPAPFPVGVPDGFRAFMAFIAARIPR